VKVAGHRRGASLEYAGEWIYFKGASEADVHFLGLGVRLGLLSAEIRVRQGSVPETGLLRVP